MVHVYGTKHDVKNPLHFDVHKRGGAHGDPSRLRKGYAGL